MLKGIKCSLWCWIWCECDEYSNGCIYWKGLRDNLTHSVVWGEFWPPTFKMLHVTIRFSSVSDVPISKIISTFYIDPNTFSHLYPQSSSIWILALSLTRRGPRDVFVLVWYLLEIRLLSFIYDFVSVELIGFIFSIVYFLLKTCCATLGFCFPPTQNL